MPFLDSTAITASRPKLTVVPAPEWGGEGAEVAVRGMSGTQRFAFEAYNAAHPDADIRPTLAVFTLCDGEGAPLFVDAAAGIETLHQVDSVALDRVFKAAVELNRLSRKSVEDLEKN